MGGRYRRRRSVSLRNEYMESVERILERKEKTMKKVLFLLMILMVIAPAMGASLRQIQVNFVDEFGVPVTTITSITVFNSGLGTSPTIYSDRAATLTVTNPITTISDNSTFDQSLGLVRWFQQKPTYKLTVTDGTKTLTIDSRNELDTRFAWYDNYIGTAASLSVGDNQSIVVGTDSDMVLAWNNGSDFMSWIPASDGSAFNLGTSGTGANVDFNWFVGTALGIKANEGTATLVIDGVTTSINASSNFATNINTGTSTGAVTIGNGAAGTVALDTDGGMTINADDSIDMTTSGAAADIDIDAAAGTVIIDGGEAAADAVQVVSAGGMDITLADSFDLSLVSGTTDENLSLILSGATASSVIITSSGTGADAIDINTSAGGIDIDMAGGAAGEDFSITTATSVTITTSEAVADQFKLDATGAVAGNAINLETTSGGIILTADHSTNGDITLDAEDDIILTTTGALTITNTSAMTVSGTTTLTGAVTATAGIQASSVTVTATADGLTTGLIPSGTSFVTVSTDSADKVIVLPASVIGNIVWISVPATGIELQTLATTNETINTVDCDGTNELALVAGSIYRLVCTKAITWVATGTANDGANEDSLTPDAD